MKKNYLMAVMMMISSIFLFNSCASLMSSYVLMRIQKKDSMGQGGSMNTKAWQVEIKDIWENRHAGWNEENTKALQVVVLSNDWTVWRDDNLVLSRSITAEIAMVHPQIKDGKEDVIIVKTFNFRQQYNGTGYGKLIISSVAEGMYRIPKTSLK